MKKILFDNVNFAYANKQPVFDQVCFEISCEENKGYILGILGESGSGKSTLLKLLLGLEKAMIGTIKLFPSDCLFSYVPQDPVLFDHLSPLESASYFKITKNLKYHFNEALFQRISKSLNLNDILQSSRKISELSGGEKQRISLLRALSIQPDILLLDEPCNGLDQEVKQSFLIKLREITETLRILVIYITHHFDEVKFICDKVAYLIKDEKDNLVRQITQQSIDEFYDTTPAKGALAMLNFPQINLFKVEEFVDHFLLSNQPNIYLHVSNENIVKTEETNCAFELLSQSNSYSVYKHYRTENYLVLEKDEIKNNRFNLRLNGRMKSYNERGIFSGYINAKTII